MHPKYPIYVISKGRASTNLTSRELNIMRVPHKIVIEPQEKLAYAKYWGEENLLVLPFSNLGQGSIPARNWVWEHAQSNGYDKHWILDDNIEGFHRMNRNKKPKVTSGTIFRIIEDFASRYNNLGLTGMNYYSFSKNTEPIPAYVLNTRIYSCILINHKIPFKWRGKYNEDTDLSLRVLKEGWSTVLFNTFLIGKVTTMRMSGGNTDDVYGDTNNRKEFADSLAKQHPDIVKVVWKFNRWHHQVNYQPFVDQHLKRIDNQEIPDVVNNFGMKLVEVGKENGFITKLNPIEK